MKKLLENKTTDKESGKVNLTIAFETSCDETCSAIVDGDLNILSNVVSSQIDIHKLYGGVVPEIASRNHVLRISEVCAEALMHAGVTLPEITQIAATTHPGLPGAVMVGGVFGRSLATALNIPFVAVNHIHGHIASVMLSNKDLKPPFLALVISGGHTALYNVQCDSKKNIGLRAEILSSTADDAVGEAFDKVAKILGLPYPGGPQLSKKAHGYTGELIRFVSKPNYHNASFSYSGLKTAVLNYVNTKRQKGEAINLPQVAASFQQEAAQQLLFKCTAYFKKTRVKTLCICGGVSANTHIRIEMQKACDALGVKVYFPAQNLCGDNAAMIAAAALLGVSG